MRLEPEARADLRLDLQHPEPGADASGQWFTSRCAWHNGAQGSVR
jgi:hypothetical protein